MKRLNTIRIVNAENGNFIVRWGEGRVQKTQDFKNYADAETLAYKLYTAAGGAGSAEAFDHTGTPPGKVLRLFADEIGGAS